MRHQRGNTNEPLRDNGPGRASDSLSRVADRCEVRLSAIARANPKLSAHPERLHPGDIVSIPSDRPRLRVSDFRLSTHSTTPVIRRGPNNDDDMHLLSYERFFAEDELWPAVRAAALEYRVPPLVLLGIIMKESSGRNLDLHRDGTGRGFIGLDPSGQLRDFLRWSREHDGRDRSEHHRPVVFGAVHQIEFLALRLSEMRDEYRGNLRRAVAAWHTGGAMDEEYVRLVEGFMADFTHEGARTIPTTRPRD